MNEIVNESQKQYLLANIPKLMGVIPVPENRKEEICKRIVTTALLVISENPLLQKCTNISLLKTLMDMAQLDLDPTPALGEAYIVPYKTEAKLIIGYRGLIALTRRSGEIKQIVARVVREGDEFDYSFGLNEDITHRPKTSSKDAKITHVYAIATLQDGTKQFDVMDSDEIAKIRNSSRSGFGEYSPWTTFFDEMAKKTVVRRLFKMLPTSKVIQDAAAIDEQVDIIAKYHEVKTEKEALEKMLFAPKEAKRLDHITTDEIPFEEQPT